MAHEKQYKDDTPLPEGDLYQVALSYACFRVTVSNNRVIEATPIGKWMIGKTVATIGEWVAKKHGTLRKVG